MRAYELEESAVDELKDRLPKLNRHNYDTIDRLMQNISIKHKITGKKLHDMFVSKYGHTPDTWIKKYKNKLGEEDVTEVTKQSAIKQYKDIQDYKPKFNNKPKSDTEEFLKITVVNPKKQGVAERVDIDHNKNPNYPTDPATIKHRIDTAKALLSDPRTDPDSRREASAILAKSEKGVAEGEVLPLKRPMSKVQHGKRTFPPTQRDVKKPEGNVTPLNQKKSNVSEGVEGPDDVQKIKDFIKWSHKTLNIQKPYPRITISKNTEVAQKGHHTGVHKGNDIWVYVGNRNLIDIFRTIFHELTHHRQMQLNMIKDGDSYPGSPIEMLADMAAGKYIKIYGKDHPEMFQ